MNNKQNLIPDIPGVDTAKGIVMTGGKEANYRTVLSMFCKDVESRLPLLQAAPKIDALSAFIIQVHSLKSTCASIGAAQVSALAAELEATGKAGDLELVKKRLPAFAEQLTVLVKNIYSALEAAPCAANNEIPPPEYPENSSSDFVPLLRELAAALESQKAQSIDLILEQLAQQHLDADIKAVVEQISDEVLMAEYGKAGKILEGLFAQITRR